MIKRKLRGLRQISKTVHLYHGTTAFFDRPNLDKAKPYKDFGKGFYLTTNLSQAGKWAVRDLDHNNIKHFGYIYEYILEMDALKTLSCLELLTYDEEWIKTITWYRNNLERQPKYDLIYDRMADSRYQELIDILQKYDRHHATAQEVLAIAQFKDTDNDQYCFKTEKALSCIYRKGYATVYKHNKMAKVIKWYDSVGKERANE